MNNNIIILKDVNKIVIENGIEISILKDINLSIRKGEFLSITGKSGSGKSTLLNVIGLLDTYERGSYLINGENVYNFDEKKRAFIRNKFFGFVFQKYYLLKQLSVKENIILPTIYAKNEVEDYDLISSNLINTLKLGTKLNTKVTDLSGGQQQRICIARALINNNPVILADEPTGALDTINSKIILNILKELHDKGHTIILVTHDPNLAKVADRCIDIQDGMIVAEVKQNCNKICKDIVLYDEKKDKIKIYSWDFIKNILKMAFYSIYYYKLRSLLTLLGIIIGIISIIFVFGIGESSQKQVLKEINAIGTNFIEIFPGNDFGDLDNRRLESLTLSDYNILKKNKYIDKISPFVSVQNSLLYKSKFINCILQGVNQDYFYIKKIIIKNGRMINYFDIKQNKTVVDIDESTAIQLFGSGKDALGKTIFLQKHPFKIIGVVSNPLVLFKQNNPIIFMPYTTLFNKIIGVRNLDSIIIKVNNNYNQNAIEKTIFSILNTKHGFNNDFHIFNADSLKSVLNKTNNIFQLLIISSAFIALLIGGIGVMNIMLVTVSERRFEIGLRIAVGATPKTILLQFLFESIILCLIGSLIGIIIAISIIPLFNILPLDIKLDYSLFAIILAVISSILTGITFGYLPAKHGAEMLPSEALKCD